VTEDLFKDKHADSLTGLDPECVPLGPSSKRAVSLYEVVVARCQRHKHSVDIGFVEERGWLGDSGRNADVSSLADLALVTGLDVPPDVRLERGPPETVQEHVASSIKATVSKVIMGIVDE